MDINYNELFDIETAETVEDTPDAAQDAEQEQEPQEQAQPIEGEKAPESEPEKPEQTPEERSRQAEGRRRREWEERGAKAERERNNALIASMGIVYPDGHEKAGQVISTLDELEAYKKNLRDTRLKEGRANDGDIREVVREEIARASEPEKNAETQPSSDPRIDAELRQIQALDPDLAQLKSSGDVLTAILQSDYGQQFRAYVDRRLTFLEAYKLAAGDKLDKRKAAQAAEAARVQAASKDHLSATGSRGQGALSVPADEMAMYRVFNPDASAEEIQKHYNADRKRYGPK